MSRENNANEFMTVDEAATYLRVNKATVYRLLTSGKLPAARVGRQYRLGKMQIDDWLRRTAMKTQARILVIDDEETIRFLVKATLEDVGHLVATAGSGPEGLEFIKRENFDLVFLDLKMPGMDGAEVFGQIRQLKPKLPVIIITGYPESDLMSRALASGPFAVMNKPFVGSQVVSAVEDCLKIK